MRKITPKTKKILATTIICIVFAGGVILNGETKITADSSCQSDMTLESLGYLQSDKSLKAGTSKVDSPLKVPSKVDATVYILPDVPVPDAATRFAIVVSRENSLKLEVTQAGIIVKGLVFDGSTWAEYGSYKTDDSISIDKCGNPFNLSYNDSRLPEGKNRIVSAFVTVKPGLLIDNVFVLFQ